MKIHHNWRFAPGLSLRDRFSGSLVGTIASTWPRSLAIDLLGQWLAAPATDESPAALSPALGELLPVELIRLPQILLAIDRPDRPRTQAAPGHQTPESVESRFETALTLLCGGDRPQPSGLVGDWLARRPPLTHLAALARLAEPDRSPAEAIALYAWFSGEGCWATTVSRADQAGGSIAASFAGALVGAAIGQTGLASANPAGLPTQVARDLSDLGDRLLAQWSGQHPQASRQRTAIGTIGRPGTIQRR